MTTDETELTVRERLQRMILIKAFLEALEGFAKAERDEVLEMLLVKYREEGSKSFDVPLPNGGKVAGVTLPVPKATDEIVDEAALFEYAEAQGAIVKETIPAVRRHIRKTIKASWFADMIKKATEGEDGDLVDFATGEIIPGVKRKPGGEPKSFTVRFEADGRDKVATAYRRGELDNLTRNTALPSLGTGE